MATTFNAGNVTARTQLLTVDEVLGVLRISRSKLYELLAAGAIDSVQIGTRRLFTEDALAGYIARNTITGGDAA